jgi:uncharacterized protein (TIGR00661 family)
MEYNKIYKNLIFLLLFLVIKSHANTNNYNSILLNAEPFGFGPASIIAQIATKLKQNNQCIGYIGEGFTLDLQQQQYYQDIIKMPPQAEETAIRNKLKQLRKKYSHFFSASDFKYARIAKEEGFIVGVYDPLAWFWRNLPDVLPQLDLYIAQNFIGVNERLAKTDTLPKQTKIISSLTPSSLLKNQANKNKRQLFINLGGLQNPLINNNLFDDFISVLSKSLISILPEKFDKFQFATSKKFLSRIDTILNPETLTYSQVIKNLQDANISLMTPGLGNIFEAASNNVAVIWLMPMNDSQGQQLKLLQKEQLIDWYIDWNDITEGKPIDYFASKAEVMEQISSKIAEFTTNTDYQEKFITILQQKLVDANNYQQTNNKLKIANIINRFGNDGMEELINALLAWSSATQTAINDDNAKSTIMWKTGGNLTIEFESDINFNWSEKDTIEFGAHIPELAVCSNNQNVIADFKIKHHFINSNTIELKHSNNQLDIFSNWQQQFPADFLHLLYGICRKLWLAKNIYPVHGALVSDSTNNYKLLVGTPGSGKTSTALALAKQGYNIVSGDKTLVTIDTQGKMRAISGTKTITIRQQDKHKLNFINYNKIYKSNERISLTMNIEDNKDAIINSIFLINLNDGSNYSGEVGKPSALHTLYPFFMDKQREDILIGEDQDILDGNIATIDKQQLAKKLKQSLLTIPVTKITGSINKLTNIITNNQQQDTTKKSKKILIGICGIGNGHINRQMPLITNLLDNNHELIVFTYGQGVANLTKLLANRKNIKIIKVANPYIVGCNQGLDFLQTAQHTVNQDINYNINMLAMHKVVEQFNQADLVISDYEAISAQYAYAKQVPLITIDQQSKYLIGDFPKSINDTSYLDEIERLNMFFPVAKQRIALSFFKVKAKENANKQVTILPPILKTEILEAKNKPLSEQPLILVYISSQQMCDFSVKHWAETLADNLPKNFKAHFFIPKTEKISEAYKNIIFHHHGDSEFKDILFSCHGIISTAGHSLLSEAMYLEKPVYAIPIALYEQQLNAQVIANGNFGVIDNNLNAEKLKLFFASLENYRENIKNDTSLLLKSLASHPLVPLINNILNQ